MEGLQQLWEHMQSMDRTCSKVAYGVGVATGAVGMAAGAAFAAKIASHWVIYRYDELETKAIERIMRKVDNTRTAASNVALEKSLPESKSDGA